MINQTQLIINCKHFSMEECLENKKDLLKLGLIISTNYYLKFILSERCLNCSKILRLKFFHNGNMIKIDLLNGISL